MLLGRKLIVRFRVNPGLYVVWNQVWANGWREVDFVAARDFSRRSRVARSSVGLVPVARRRDSFGGRRGGVGRVGLSGCWRMAWMQLPSVLREVTRACRGPWMRLRSQWRGGLERNFGRVWWYRESAVLMVEAMPAAAPAWPTSRAALGRVRGAVGGLWEAKRVRESAVRWELGPLAAPSAVIRA